MAATSHDISTPNTSPASYHVKCRIYGEETFSEPCLVDLLNSKAVQRLQHVSQHGISSLKGLVPEPTVTRLEHSIGAAILVRRAGGSLEAQAAALLHDIAHTALSHTVDTVWGRVVHETDKDLYLSHTDIPQILKKHFECPEKILDESLYSLVEMDPPRLCADRLDYGIRDIFAFKILDSEQVGYILKHITVHDGVFAVDSIEAARMLSDAYMKCDDSAWSNLKHAALYRLAAEAIRIAHDKGILTDQDLWKTDNEFWSILENTNDEQVAEAVRRVSSDIIVERLPSSTSNSNSNDTNTVTANNNPVEINGQSSKKIITTKIKVRTIDPDVVVTDDSTGQKICKPLSYFDQEYNQKRQEYISSKAGNLTIAISKPE